MSKLNVVRVGAALSSLGALNCGHGPGCRVWTQSVGPVCVHGQFSGFEWYCESSMARRNFQEVVSEMEWPPDKEISRRG